MAPTILVVEDEPVILMNVADQFDDAGFLVLEASTADEALSHLEDASSIDLLFTDIDMPGRMDGLQLAVAVAARWPHVRIILASGRRMVEITDIPSGSVFYAKPYSSKLIMDTARRLLRAS